jgi:hypothetical protein
LKGCKDAEAIPIFKERVVSASIIQALAVMDVATGIGVGIPTPIPAFRFSIP